METFGNTIFGKIRKHYFRKHSETLFSETFGNTIFGIVTTVMLVIFAIKAFQGKPIHIEAVDDLTNWLEDKIKPGE